MIDASAALLPPIPDDWVTVELSHQELREEAASGRWHGKVELGFIALHMLAQRGIRVLPEAQRLDHSEDPPIELPAVVINHDAGMTVHQGPRPKLH